MNSLIVVIDMSMPTVSMLVQLLTMMMKPVICEVIVTMVLTVLVMLACVQMEPSNVSLVHCNDVVLLVHSEVVVMGRMILMVQIMFSEHLMMSNVMMEIYKMVMAVL